MCVYISTAVALPRVTTQTCFDRVDAVAFSFLVSDLYVGPSACFHDEVVFNPRDKKRGVPSIVGRGSSTVPSLCNKPHTAERQTPSARNPMHLHVPVP